jgi:hypothetical protein
MSTSCCMLLDHAHIGDQHIPSFADSIHIVLQDYEHATLHTPRSCPHWRSTHTFLHLFYSLSTTILWVCHVAYSSIMPTLEMNTSLPLSIQFTYYYKIMIMSRCIPHDHAHIGDQHIPSFVNSIHIVLQEYEHITLHTPRSCPHWRSTHTFLRRFDLLSTTKLWAYHVAYFSIMPTLEVNTSLPLLIQFAYYNKIMSMSRCILLDHAHIGDQDIPSFIDLIRLILHDHEHVTLHTPRSYPLWRWTNLPSFVDSILLVL